MKHCLSVCCLLILAVARPASWAEDRLLFESDVRPILKAHCWHCHGEDSELQGGLDTRLSRLLLKGGDSGSAVVPGDHQSSLLYQRVEAGEMPPGKVKLSATEIQTLSAWIDSGARTARAEPEEISPEALLLEEDRQHWSFQPITRPEPPAVQSQSLVQSPVDAFLLQRLEAAGQTFAPEADKETLIRRAYFDLTGLPPSPEAIDQFLAAESSDAWEQLIDQLLQSPQYGERWARHWLDVAGYADSDGYTEKDPERKWAYKYRDYVIRAFNQDKPWNQFLLEQLAGDELLQPPYQDLTAEQTDYLTATGFLRMAPDGTGDGSVDKNVARNDVIAETLKVVSTSVLGLTVGCAQCHDHRYDPILQADYYRMRAIFEPAYDVTNWKAPNARLISLWPADVRAQAAAVDKELKDVADARSAELDQIVADTFERELKKLPADQQLLAREARDTAADKRTEQQQQLIKQYPFLNVNRGTVYLYLPDRLNGHKKKWDDKTAEIQKKRPDEDMVMCLTETPGKVPVTKLFSRGDYQQPREEMPPAELTILTSIRSSAGDDGSALQIALNDDALPTTGRRLAYARHLTSGQHPLVARVLVNRFWMHHFGQGIVATPADFGVKGEAPSHPELLDWLAASFMDEGWTLKRLHRVIMSSRAYRQSSVRRPELDAIDPENRLLGRMSVRRLEAEAVRDALLAVSGQLVPTMYGPPVPVSPDEIGQIVLMKDNRDSAGRPSGKAASLGGEEFRRSLYVQARRSMPLGVLEPFDLPTMTPNCELRPSSTGPSQALLMMNNPFVVQASQATAARLRTLAGEDRGQQVQLAWRMIFGKTPTTEEQQDAVNFLTATSEATAATAKGNPAEPAAPDLALAHLCHALLCSNGFLYVD